MMGEFFRGWKRKFGVVTLVMACVFLACWIRSLSGVTDRFKIHTDVRENEFLESVSWGIGWAKYDDTTIDDIGNPSHGENPTLRWLGFRIGKYSIMNERHTFFYVPHWSIVIPLTLLSAYLLLSKPRKSTPKTISEPIAVEGA